MNKKTKLVLDLLKPKAQPLGFTKEELEGVAERIANNLGLEDDATDEAVTEAATKAVDAQMFYLELSQKSANRIIQKNKEEREKEKAEEERKAKEAAQKAKEEAERKAAEEAARKKAEEDGYQKFLDSDWAKNMQKENAKLANMLKEQKEANEKAMNDFQAFRTELNAMKAETQKAAREKKLEKLLEGTGVFGERIKKNYAKMSFETDADFDDFVNGVQDDIKAFNQERADKGLDRLGAPAAGDRKDDGKVDPMTDAEVDALAAIM